MRLNLFSILLLSSKLSVMNNNGFQIAVFARAIGIFNQKALLRLAASCADDVDHRVLRGSSGLYDGDVSSYSQADTKRICHDGCAYVQPELL